MFWGIASSVFVIYLYRKLNAEAAPIADTVSSDDVEVELAAINARIDALERKIGTAGAAEAAS